MLGVAPLDELSALWLPAAGKEIERAPCVATKAALLTLWRGEIEEPKDQVDVDLEATTCERKAIGWRGSLLAFFDDDDRDGSNDRDFFPLGFPFAFELGNANAATSTRGEREGIPSKEGRVESKGLLVEIDGLLCASNMLLRLLRRPLS
jgi:hypothetical protein